MAYVLVGYYKLSLHTDLGNVFKLSIS